MDSFPELRNYYLSEMNSDLTLVVEGHRLPAHRFVLAAKSPVFNAMFYGDLMESTAREVDIREAPVDAFRVMLRYIYSERFEMDNDKDFQQAIQVFKLGHRYQLHRLVQYIEQYLITMLKKHNYIRLSDTITSASYDDFLRSRRFDNSLLSVIDNIATIYEFAVLYELTELVNACQRFIAKNSKLIVKKKSYLTESFDTMESILGLMQTNPAVIVQALQKIRDQHPGADMSQFERLVNFDTCSVDDIQSVRTIRLFSDDKLFDVLIAKYKTLQLEMNKVVKDRRA
ncbi:BTB/POZ domain-containing protein 9-like [Oppia nitens]|uniref:BTB/POZ domain-containing protein 9-like n=1 Tax=Oppia nitens TaxID=1686743 RepID=UPI0023DBA9F5|nr:BTB/POZ domain-containing protein 9-like [Oppia nitens]